jgi:hypothetical protein
MWLVSATLPLPSELLASGATPLLLAASLLRRPRLALPPAAAAADAAANEAAASMAAAACRAACSSLPLWWAWCPPLQAAAGLVAANRPSRTTAAR